MRTDSDYSGNPTEESITDIIGEELMAQLSRDLGGRRVYVPTNPGEHSPMTVSIGLDAAQKIGETFGGAFFDVPLTIGTKKKVIELYKQGMKKVRISATLGKSIRYVRRICNEYQPDGIQSDLFDK